MADLGRAGAWAARRAATVAAALAVLVVTGCGAPEQVVLPAWAEPAQPYRAAAAADAKARYDLLVTGAIRSYVGQDDPLVRELAVLPPRTRDELVAALDTALADRGLTRIDLGETDAAVDHSSVLWRDGEDDEPVVLVWAPDALPSDKGRPAAAILLEPRR